MFFVIGALVTPLSIIIAIFASIAMMLDLLDVLENRKFNKGFYSDTEFEDLVKEERKKGYKDRSSYRVGFVAFCVRSICFHCVPMLIRRL